MHRPYLETSIVVFLSFALLAGHANARTWLVPAEVPTIAAALDSASAGDVVELACGTYHEHDLPLKAQVVVRSEDGTAGCATVDAQQQGRVFVAEDLASPAVLLGLTITGGVAPPDDYYGGGIHCRNASLNLAQCELRDNTSPYSGGGLYFRGGTLIVSSTVFAENASAEGSGGAARILEADGEFLDCRFEANTAVDGGAIMISFSDLDLNFCTFLANDGQFFGGAILDISETDLGLRHCSLVGNTAHLGGGIMVASYSHAAIEDCIIAFNHAGAGIELHDESSSVDLACSDVHGNEDGGYSGHLDDQTGQNGNLDLDPYFCDLEGGDLSLASVSPCLPLNNGCATLMGALGQGCVLTPVVAAAPAAVSLAPNLPNPFNPRTTIRFRLDALREVELCIHDLAGRRVAVLTRGRLGAGSHEVVWSGLDDRGRPQPSGTYLCRLQADAMVVTRPLTLVR